MKKLPPLLNGETQDKLLGGHLTLKQPSKGYRFGIDAVLLSSTVRATYQETILDVGCGVGAVLLCAGVRETQCQLVGLEIQPELAELARYNTQQNEMEERTQIILGSINKRPENLIPNSFDHVVTNPPYMADESSDPSPYSTKAISHHGSDTSLEQWIDFCKKMLKPKGQLSMIHRADRLPELLFYLNQGFGESLVFPLWPKQNKAAKRVIVQAKKGVRTATRLLQGLVLHNEDGSYTSEINEILKTPKYLPLEEFY